MGRLPSGRGSRGRLQLLLLLAREHPVRSLLVLGAVFAALWLVVDYLHVSELEEVLQTIEAVRDAVVAADIEGIMEHVAPEFSAPRRTSGRASQRLGRRALAGGLRMALMQEPVGRAFIVSRDVQIRSGTARVELRVVSYQGGRMATSDWVVVLERRDDRWLIRRVTPVQIQGWQVGSLEELIYRWR